MVCFHGSGHRRTHSPQLADVYKRQGQGEAARGLCGTAWSLALTGKDYAGLDRYLLAIRGQVRERNIPAAANPCGDTGQEVTTHEMCIRDRPLKV